jgi:EF hand
MWRQLVLLMFVTATLSGAAVAALKVARGDPIERFDTNGDGLLDLAEVKAAAAAVFAEMDRDLDGALDKIELAGRWSTRWHAAADADHDGRLTADEYLVAVEQHFNRADAHNEGSLGDTHLKSGHGKALLRMIR